MDRLPDRLLGLYEMITGRVCADIGADHALLPCFLVKSGKCDKAFACDIRPGPLSAARKNIENFGLSGSVETLLCDGIHPSLLSLCDTIVIAGMGGETIADILSRAKIRRGDLQLVLQPMTRAAHLRKYLNQNNFAITRETFCLEGGRVYAAIEAYLAPDVPYTAAQLEIGRFAKRQSCQAAKRYIRKTLAALERRRAGLQRGGRADGAFELQRVIDEIKEDLP